MTLKRFKTALYIAAAFVALFAFLFTPRHLQRQQMDRYITALRADVTLATGSVTRYLVTYPYWNEDGREETMSLVVAADAPDATGGLSRNQIRAAVEDSAVRLGLELPSTYFDNVRVVTHTSPAQIAPVHVELGYDQ